MIHETSARSLFVAVMLTMGCGSIALAGQTTAQGRTRGADAPIVLDRTTTIFVGADEPGPVAQAAQDLASDFEKVLGEKPRDSSEAVESAVVRVPE